MPHSHHSHSSSYCNHAQPHSSLRSIVQRATALNFSTYALTEHCPHDDAYLYPGEEVGWTCAEQWGIFDRFIEEAVGLRGEWEGKEEGKGEGGGGGTGVSGEDANGERAKRKSSTKLLIGFESEWISPASSTKVIQTLLTKYDSILDFFVGSVHHVRTIPIDYDRAHYSKAVAACWGDEVELFCEYFDAQGVMLEALRPRVVGHFDLVRLMSEWERGRGRVKAGQEEKEEETWKTVGGGRVWGRIVKNLRCVREYGGVLELNSSGLRKGLSEPYPASEIVREWDGMGGLCVLSDDCHGLDQVGTNYGRLLEFVVRVGLSKIAYLDKEGRDTVVRTMSIDELKKHPYWNASSRNYLAACISWRHSSVAPRGIQEYLLVSTLLAIDPPIAKYPALKRQI